MHNLRVVLIFLTGATLSLSQAEIFRIGFLSATVNKTVVGVLLGLAILIWLNERQPIPRVRNFAWVAALSASFVIGCVIGLLKGQTLPAIILSVISLAAVVLFYYLLLYIVRTREELDILFWGVFVTVAISSLSVVLGVNTTPAGRSGGFEGDPNHFSYNAVVTLPVMVAFYFTTRNRMARMAIVTIGVLTLLAVIGGRSRGALVAMLAMGTLWSLRFRRLDLMGYVLIVALLIGGGLVFFAPPEYWERMATLTSPEAAAEDGSIQSRILVGRFALAAFSSNPLVGVGFSYFPTWADTADVSIARTGHVGTVHNSYLHVAAELGLVGLIPYLGVMFVAWREYDWVRWAVQKLGSRADQELRRLYVYATFLQIGFFGTLVDNLFLSSLRYRFSWLLVGSASVLLNLVHQRIAELGEKEAASSEPAGSDLVRDDELLGSSPRRAH